MSLKVTFQGNPMTLEGSELTVGSKMPDFTLTSNELTPVKLSDLSGVKVFLTVPSLDTPICDLETKRFNEKATELKNVKIYCVSLDLPFAQTRWCGAHDIKNVVTLSDYSDRSFGLATGTFIKELALLTRAVIVVDADNNIKYVEYVKEIVGHPDYDAVYDIIKQI